MEGETARAIIHIHIYECIDIRSRIWHKIIRNDIFIFGRGERGKQVTRQGSNQKDNKQRKNNWLESNSIDYEIDGLIERFYVFLHMLNYLPRVALTECFAGCWSRNENEMGKRHVFP